MTASVLRLPLPDPDRVRRRASVRVWLRGEQARGSTKTQATASELLVCLTLRKPPSEGAIAWLRRRAQQGDRIHRDWVQCLAEELGVGL